MKPVRPDPAALRSQLAQNPQDLQLLQQLGAACAQQGDLHTAAECFEKAFQLAPEDPSVLNNLALLRKRQGNPGAAIALLEKAQGIAPRMPEAHYNAATLYALLGQGARAEQAYRRAIERRPAYPDALAGLAQLCEGRHDLVSAEHYAKRALVLAPGHPVATLVRAIVDQRAGHHPQAIGRLRALLDTPRLAPANRTLAWGALGRSLERQQDYAGAFAAFVQANDCLYATLPAGIVDAPRSVYSPQSVARLAELAVPVDGTADPVEVLDPAPVFLVGFPRSGTTLLDQVLSSHSGITVVEERENLRDVHEAFLRDAPGVAAFRTLDVQQRRRWRGAYLERLHAGLSAHARAGCVVDKLPLNLILLGVIDRLFPEARILIARRDPRDCILSCFTQHFGMNAAMYQFLKLDTAVSYYDAVMSLAARTREQLALRCYEVRYEAVVTNFETAIGAVLEFLGLPWEEAVRDYVTTARGRDIHTPSARQVVQPLYRSSIGRWRNYQAHLEPYLPVLERWVGRLDGAPG